jgi:hypothetical protein
MPKEGKNDRFARRVCESLKPHLGGAFDYVGPPSHELRQQTSFGYQTVGVHLWGANAPYRHLEFTLGVWHDAFEKARLRLDLEPTLEGALHFWQTTGNLGSGWDQFKNRKGTWDGNLNEDPAQLMPEIVPYLSEAMRTVFDACADLRGVRKLLEDRVKAPLFTMDPWEEIVIIDVALADWEHLRKLVSRKDLPRSSTANPNLLKTIEAICGVQLFEAG